VKVVLRFLSTYTAASPNLAPCRSVAANDFSFTYRKLIDENQTVNHAAILQQVVDWARSQENVRAAVLTGSVARGEDEFGELSDLDIELYVSDPSALLDHSAWYEQFGEVLVVETLENPGWHPTRLV
jgi:predicted nucleotidyltransferase